MAITGNLYTLDISRRRLLRRAALVAGGGALLSSNIASAAQTKIAQKTANYQNTPSGTAQCDNCVQWEAPASCKLVQGPISASAWCSLYAPKPKS